MAVINAIRWASTDPAFGAADLKDRYDKGIWNEKLEATYQQLQKEMSGIPIYWAAFNVHNYWGEIWNRAGTSEPWSTVAQSVAPAVDYEIKKIYEAKLEE